MTHFSVTAYFMLMMVALAVAALPMFQSIDAPSGADTRYVALDGLRGFLALGVFIFHLVVMHRFIDTGIWTPPDSRFYALLGPVGVSLFFMITGFLFWGKLLRAHGKPRWRALYTGRLFRIAPMYLCVVLAMLCIVFAHTGFALREPAAQLVSAVLQWLALGFINTQPDVNGYQATHVLAGVTWTIAYEWAFYASLLATAGFARGRVHLLFVLTALALCIAGKFLLRIDALGFAALFLCGMTAASFAHANLMPRISPRIASMLATACLLIVFTTSSSGYGTPTALLLAVFFYLVCSGASLFGLLTTRSANRLGNISYSLYLMQGLVLTLVFASTPIRDYAMASAWHYWITGAACIALLISGATLGYLYVEQPGIALGKRFARRWIDMTGLPGTVPVKNRTQATIGDSLTTP